ncbi:MAG: gamma-glutamyl-gamma-aminobutyrate hydrolase family protein [Solirubrobacteraceae bacterium]
MPRPLIALSTSELHEPHRASRVQQTLTHRRDLALGMDYPHAIAQAGGVPVVVPPTDAVDIDALLARVDGLCLSGGPDIDPSAYGAQRHPALGPTDPEVDRFELALVRAAQARDLPILCLCRGMQTLNVARGGTLIQDLPSQRPSSVPHRQEGSGTQPTHRVHVEAGCALATALQAVEIEVNTFHHQAVDRLGEGLRPVAWAPDDLIEGIEDPDQRFLVGVQWHAESLRALPEQRALFAAFTAAAVRRPSMVS